MHDIGDGGANTTAGHGSMQVHNYLQGHTIFALNHFGINGYNPYLGIGNQPTGNQDWTFNENARSSSGKNLYTVVYKVYLPTQGYACKLLKVP